MPKSLWAFWEESFNKSPYWKVFQLIWAILNAIFLFMGSLPGNFRRYWYIWLIGSLLISLFSGMYGAYKILAGRESLNKIRITELEGAREKELEYLRQQVQALNDDRDIPEVIKELKHERDNWIRGEHYEIASAQGMAPDENWFVAKLRPARSERLIRVAYKRWKADAYR